MINVFTLTIIDTKIIEGKLSKFLNQKCISNQNRRQKVFNKGASQFCGGALRLFGGA